MSKMRVMLESRLSEEQRIAAQRIIENEWSELTEGVKKMTSQELAKDIGIARSTLYKWRQDEDFIAYMAHLSDSRRNERHDEFNRSLIKAIRGGNNGIPSVKALELYAKLNGLVKNVDIIEDRRSMDASTFKTNDELRQELDELDALLADTDGQNSDLPAECLRRTGALKSRGQRLFSLYKRCINGE